jgi:hypothetical protein
MAACLGSLKDGLLAPWMDIGILMAEQPLGVAAVSTAGVLIGMGLVRLWIH